MRGVAAFVSALALVVLGGGPAACPAADPPAKEGPKEPAKGKDAAVPDLVGALKASPGCLGVETARTASGKSVIFAWFEDKKSALKWYYSDTHQEVMKRFLPDFKREGKPLASVPDNSGPIMVVASITLTGPQTKENPLPFKQIAIEVYQPLGEGLNIGGRFAPEGMKVPARKEEPKK